MNSSFNKKRTYQKKKKKKKKKKEEEEAVLWKQKIFLCVMVKQEYKKPKLQTNICKRPMKQHKIFSKVKTKHANLFCLLVNFPKPRPGAACNVLEHQINFQSNWLTSFGVENMYNPITPHPYESIISLDKQQNIDVDTTLSLLIILFDKWASLCIYISISVKMQQPDMTCYEWCIIIFFKKRKKERMMHNNNNVNDEFYICY